MQMVMSDVERVESNLEDIHLIAAFLDGDPDAFERLFHKYQNRLFSLCYRLLGRRADAEDAVQDAFLDIYAGLGRFRGESEFHTWAYSITVKKCYKRLKQCRRNTPIIHDEELMCEPANLPQVERIAIGQGLSMLPAEPRALLILKYYEQMSYEEIAMVMSCGVGRVKDRLRRARLRLKEILEDEMEGGLL